MLIINKESYVKGEIVFINNGRMQGIRGPLVGVKEEEKLALIKIGTVTSEVEFDYIERVETERPRLFMTYWVFFGDNPELIRFVSATNEEDARKKHPYCDRKTGRIVVRGINEVDGYDVILQK